MRAWATPLLIRYFADERSSPDDIICPDRPSSDHEWVDGSGWVIPADAADKRAEIVAADFESSPVFRLLLEVLFRYHNRLLALEGQPGPITRAAFKQLLIALYKQIN